MGSAQYIKNVMDVMDVLDVMDVMDVSNAFILAKNEDNAMKLSGYDPWGLQKNIKNVIDDPLCVLLFVPLTFQMLIFQPKMNIMP